MVKQLKTESEFSAYISSGLVVVVFFATWCGTCKQVLPLVKELEPKLVHIKFAKIDVEKLLPVAEACRITVMPTFVFFKRGKEIGRVNGDDREEIKKQLGKLQI